MLRESNALSERGKIRKRLYRAPEEVVNVVHKVADEYGISPITMMSFDAHRPIPEARHEAIRRVRMITHKGKRVYSLDKIGEFFGRGHPAIIYAIRKAEQRIKLGKWREVN